MIQARAIAFTDIHQAHMVDVQLPAVGPGELLVRTEISTVSPGTELRCFAGLQPDSLPFPFIPGYSLVGIVQAVHDGCPIAVGERVFVSGTKRASINLQWGGHISNAIADVNSVYRVPFECSPKAASFAKLVAIALRGLVVCQAKPKDKVVVIGLGPIGMLSARLHQAMGAEVLAVDVEPIRVQLAQNSGLTASAAHDSIVETVRTHFGELADVVVDATGNSAVLPFSMAAAKTPDWGDGRIGQSKLVIQGSYPETFTLPYQEAFRKELNIFLPRDTTPVEIAEAVKMITSGFITVEDLISWCGHASVAQSAYDLLRSNRSSMSVSFDWRIDG